MNINLCLSAEAASSSEAFQEVEGETEERRRARLNHHLRTQARMVCDFSCLPFVAFSFFCFFNGKKKKRKEKETGGLLLIILFYWNS